MRVVPLRLRHATLVPWRAGPKRNLEELQVQDAGLSWVVALLALFFGFAVIVILLPIVVFVGIPEIVFGEEGD